MVDPSARRRALIQRRLGDGDGKPRSARRGRGQRRDDDVRAHPDPASDGVVELVPLHDGAVGVGLRDQVVAPGRRRRRDGHGGGAGARRRWRQRRDLAGAQDGVADVDGRIGGEIEAGDRGPDGIGPEVAGGVRHRQRVPRRSGRRREHRDHQVGAAGHEDRAQHEQALLDPAHDDDPAREEGVVAPGPVEAREVIGGVDVEEAHLAQGAGGDPAQIDHAQAAPVVGLEGVVAADVLVVVDRRARALVDRVHVGGGETGHVPDVGARVVVEVELVLLVVHQEPRVVLGQPALVRVAPARVPGARELDGSGLVRHVHDRQRVAVRAEADLAAVVGGVGAVVRHTLGLVGVAVIAHAPGEDGTGGHPHVDHVQPAVARLAAGQVHEAARLVHGDRVNGADAAVVGRRREGHGGRRHAAQRGEVEDLHAVAARLADDEGVVREHLDAAPDGARGVGGQVAEVDGIAGVADVDERGPGRATHERVFPAREGIGPAPHVVAVAAADLRQRQEREEVDVAAGVDAGEAAHAWRGSDRAERERRLSIGELAPVEELHAALFLGLPRILRAELLPVRFLRVVGGRGRREQEVRADERQRHEKSANGNARYPHSGTAFPSWPAGRARRTSGNEVSTWISMAAPTFSDDGRRPTVMRLASSWSPAIRVALPYTSSDGGGQTRHSVGAGWTNETRAAPHTAVTAARVG